MPPLPFGPMMQLGAAGIRYVKSRLGPLEKPGLLALRHALDFPRYGLMGNDDTKPNSVLLVRDVYREIFGLGEAEPAVNWIADIIGTDFILHAPESWREPLEKRVGKVVRGEVETWSVKKPVKSGSSAIVRRLTPEDRRAFRGAAPAWSYKGWLKFDELIKHGAAFGVWNGARCILAAWIFDQAGPYDAIGVATKPQFQRLGLGRASAAALIDHIINVRGKVPLWSLTSANESSRGLAEALALSRVAVEPLFQKSSDL